MGDNIFTLLYRKTVGPVHMLSIWWRSQVAKDMGQPQALVCLTHLTRDQLPPLLSTVC